MRPKTSLAERISRATGIPVPEIEDTIANPESTAGRCWPWMGHVARISPMMKEGGVSLPVRRILHAGVIGEPVPPEVRLGVGCASMFCVNPNHTRRWTVVVGPRFDDAPSPENLADSGWSLEDAVDAIYMRPEPWDAAEIAERHTMSLDLVERAITEIQEGKW